MINITVKVVKIFLIIITVIITSYIINITRFIAIIITIIERPRLGE